MQIITSPDKIINPLEIVQFKYTDSELNDSNFMRGVRDRFYKLSAAKNRIKTDGSMIKSEIILTPLQKLQKLMDSKPNSN